ncbi:MAG TPA: replication initiator protein A [Geminicoccus sp.]|uniref:replication initiator protein A n=1 Tax=Geminicoccus sp. TaxID=2024832 RepID=UPI002E32B362|nr:replication initiator protein A [Geminicoccus sp.]HEX2525906.1 replication initiator protein A [Geminicoccus sp.]
MTSRYIVHTVPHAPDDGAGAASAGGPALALDDGVEQVVQQRGRRKGATEPEQARRVPVVTDNDRAEKQVDLFLDSLINAPFKDDRALMEFPFFSLQKTPRTKPMIYDDGKVRVEIRPGDRGIATIWDKDVLIYLASIINDRIERGMPVEKTVRFNAYNLLQVTGRGSGKRGYELLLDAIYRLRSTTIVTTIESQDVKERRGFGWIETFRILERKTRSGKKVMAGCEITLNDWMFRAIVKDRRVLTISPQYFQISMGLKRRLYELARKHCGAQARWVISLPKLIDKCGSVMEARFFKPQLRKIVEDDDLPDYHIAINFDPADRQAVEEDGFDGRRWASNERLLVVFSPRSSARIGTSSTTL